MMSHSQPMTLEKQIHVRKWIRSLPTYGQSLHWPAVLIIPHNPRVASPGSSPTQTAPDLISSFVNYVHTHLPRYIHPFSQPNERHRCQILAGILQAFEAPHLNVLRSGIS